MDQEYLNLFAEKAQMEVKYITELGIAQIQLEMQTRISEEQDQIIRKQKKTIEEAQQSIADRDSKIALTKAGISKLDDEFGRLKGFLAEMMGSVRGLLKGARGMIAEGTQLIMGAYSSGYARGWTDAGGDDVEQGVRTQSLVVEMTPEERARLLGPLEKKFKDWMDAAEALADESVNEKLKSFGDSLRGD